MNHVRAVAVVAIMGCGAGAKKSTAPKPAPCIAMATHMGELVASGAGVSDSDKNQVAATVDVIGEQCQSSPWSSAAIECISQATTTHDLDRCEQYITPAQQAAVRDGVSARVVSKPSGAEDTMQRDLGGSDGSAKGGAGAPTSSADPCGGDE
jgi:hypothetical protein